MNVSYFMLLLCCFFLLKFFLLYAFLLVLITALTVRVRKSEILIWAHLFSSIQMPIIQSFLTAYICSSTRSWILPSTFDTSIKFMTLTIHQHTVVVNPMNTIYNGKGLIKNDYRKRKTNGLPMRCSFNIQKLLCKHGGACFIPTEFCSSAE